MQREKPRKQQREEPELAWLEAAVALSAQNELDVVTVPSPEATTDCSGRDFRLVLRLARLSGEAW